MLRLRPTATSPCTAPLATPSPPTAARTPPLPPWPPTSPEYQERITQSTPRFQRPLSAAKDKLMEVTMLIQKLNVRHSTSVLLMELEVLPSTASCVPMELCSIRTTSSATGGSTLTALQPRNSTASMMKLPLREMLLLELQIKQSTELLPRTPMLPQPQPHQHMTTMLLP